MTLAPYAVTEENSRGRQHPIDLAKDRSGFRRDYTRILHSRAFRLLQGKTQVFSSAHGEDRVRTRMSHSLEVDQLSQSLCARLGLNSDLASALAIGHDIGHAPFGHLGQDVLNEMMAGHGGFEHNLQALRLVDQLESPYLEHRGLNLMFETREGLLKHCTSQSARGLGDVAQRHLDKTSPPLEMQAVDLADAVAYCHADLEDAFVMGLLSIDDLMAAPGYQSAWESYADRTFGHRRTPFENHPTSADFEKTDPEKARRASAIMLAVLREMIALALEDAVSATRQRLEASGVQSLEDVRRCPPLVGFSSAGAEQHQALKRFSRERIYSHPRIVSARVRDRQVLEGLFRAYVRDPLEMGNMGAVGPEGLHRTVADHMVSMTDRGATQEFERLLAARPELLSHGQADAPPRRVRGGP